MIEFQIEMEKLFHKNQLLPRIISEFKTDPGFEIHMNNKDINLDFGFNLLAQMVLHKRCSLPTLVGILRGHFDGDCQKTADELWKACTSNLVDWNPRAIPNGEFILKWDVTQAVREEMDRYQYPLPMVVPPKELRVNSDTGYYTSKNSVILKKNHHDNDLCLDHLNRVNQIPLRLNMDVATTIKNKWRNLDKKKPDEDLDKYKKRVKAFEKYDRTAHDVLLHLGLANGGICYLTHKYDKRGRCYAQGYHVTYQGASWNKAVICFVNEEVTT